MGWGRRLERRKESTVVASHVDNMFRTQSFCLWVCEVLAVLPKIPVCFHSSRRYIHGIIWAAEQPLNGQLYHTVLP